MATILRPVSLAISAAVASRTSLRREQIATSTPSFASRRATPLPMPSLPPVTSDAELAPGDAILEFDGGHADARLGVRLAALLEFGE